MQIPRPSFADIKQKLDAFDQSILESWQQNIERDKDNIYRYLLDLPTFPMDPAALVAPPNSLTLEQVARVADAAGESDLSITLDDMRLKFGFSAEPIPRPPLVVPKPRKRKKKRDKDKEKKDQKKGHGKRKPGQPPKSESVVFHPTKK